MKKVRLFEQFINEGKYDKELEAFNSLKNNSKTSFYRERPDVTEEALLDDSVWTNTVGTGTYKVYELDQDGRYSIGTVGYYKADSKKHARLVAALDKKNLEIYLTGFYSAEMTDASKEIADRNAQIKALQMQIAQLKKAK